MWIKEKHQTDDNISNNLEDNIMKNHEHLFSDKSFDRLNIKIFVGSVPDVEKELSDFINSKPMTIERMMQSEINGENGLTITVMYYDTNPANFIAKETTAKMFYEMILDHVMNEHGVSFNDILDFIYKS